MITSFDISQEIFSIDIMTALKFSLKHRRKHVLRSFRLYGDLALASLSILFTIKIDVFPLFTRFNPHSGFFHESNY